MANLATVTIQFQSTGGQQVAQETNQILALMQKLGAQFGIATTLGELTANAIIAIGKAMVDLTNAAIDAYKAFETNISALAIYNTSIQSTSAQLQRLREIALQPGLSLDQVLKGVTYLEAAGFSAQIAERAIRVFGNALALAGKGSEDLAGVQLALGQIKSKGIISAEEINQIAERIPQVRRAMVAAFGTGNAKKIEEQGKTATEFITKILDELDSKKGKLPVAAQTITSFMKNATDAFKYAAIIIGRGFADILNQSSGLKLAAEFFNNIKEIAIEISGVFSGFAQTTAFQDLQKNIKDTLVIFHSLIPGMTRSFVIGLSVFSVMVNEIFKLGNALYNFFGQLFHEPVKLWEKELAGFMDWVRVNLARPFEGLAETILKIPARIKLLSPDAAIRQQGKEELQRIEFNQKLFDKQYLESIQGKRAVQQTPFTKAIIATGNFVTQFGMIDDLFPTRNKGLIAKMLEQYDETMLKKGFLSVLPPGLQPGGVGDQKDQKDKDDDNKKKQLKALEIIATNTKKLEEYTLRNLTYGGGQLAKEGISAVQMSGYQTVSSPQISGNNDIVRGIQKIVREYSNSNNLNFSFRRS